MLSNWGLTAWAVATGKNNLLQIAMLALALAFAGLYSWMVLRRQAVLRPFVYVRGRNYAVMIHPGKYQGTLRPEVVLGQFHAAFQQWRRAFDGSEIEAFARDQLFWVWLVPHPAPCGRGSQKIVEGFEIARPRKIVASYRSPREPLSQTTMQHEIGHAIQGGLTGSWMLTGHHERLKRLELR